MINYLIKYIDTYMNLKSQNKLFNQVNAVESRFGVYSIYLSRTKLFEIMQNQGAFNFSNPCLARHIFQTQVRTIVNILYSIYLVNDAFKTKNQTFDKLHQIHVIIQIIVTFFDEPVPMVITLYSSQLLNVNQLKSSEMIILNFKIRK